MSLHAPYPHGRPRRLRRDEFTRNLVREHALTPHDGRALGAAVRGRYV